MIFKLNQEIIGRKPKYVEMCNWRLKRWQEFMVQECEVTDVEEAIEPMYIQYRQQLGTEKPITLNNQIAMLKVFFSYLIDEEYHEEKNNPMQQIKSLKEEKRFILTFNDAEVMMLRKKRTRTFVIN